MSHFCVLVTGKNVKKQLAPFDEGKRVPKYVEHTKQQLIDNQRAEDNRFLEGTGYKEFLEKPEELAEESPKRFDFFKHELPERLAQSDEEVYERAVRWYDKEDIGKNGEVYSTYNPKSKWDWYEIGGRWAGRLKVKESEAFNVDSPNFSWDWDAKSMAEVLKEPRTDSCLISELEDGELEKIKTFAILHDGKWVEKGEMMMFGMVKDSKDENDWDRQVSEFLKSLPKETRITMVDCHI